MVMDAWKISCLTCSWSNIAADKFFVEHSAIVHTEMLTTGHTAGAIEYLPQGWVR
jgi:hypothetical protein